MTNFAKKYFEAVPLGMNLRNFLLREGNPDDSMRLAKDKAEAKKMFQKHDIPTAETFFEIESYYDLDKIKDFPAEFVIKPSRGYAGKGIMVLKRKSGVFVNPAGETFDEKYLRRHIRKIIDGEFSGYMEKDTAIIEERIYPSPKLIFARAAGLPDIRIFCVDYNPVMAMMRYATKETKGRANLSAGAVGLGIDIGSGKISHIHRKHEEEKIKMSDLGIPENFVMPKWEEMKKVAAKTSKITGLKVSGVDLILDSRDRVLVIEINGRPGIEIQNINEKSLLDELSKLL